MADSKISALPASTTPLAGTEVLPIVQSSTTRQVSVANLTAGRAISATQLTLTTGSVIVASGQGIDFSATAGTGTSELLNDYEEGTWTPTQGTGLTVVGTFSSSGSYTKVGRMVTVRGRVSGSTSVSIVANSQLCAGLPFTGTTGTEAEEGALTDNNITQVGVAQIYGATVYSTAITATTRMNFTISYFV